MNSKSNFTDALRVVGKPRYKRITESDAKFIPSGYQLLSECINDFESRTITIIAGCPGDGKSTVVQSISLGAIDEGYKVLIVDGEHPQERLINKLYVKVIGYDQRNYDSVKFNNRWVKEPKPHILEQLEEWHQDNMMIYSRNLAQEITTLEELFSLLEYYVSEMNVDLVILDNMMSLIFANNDDTNKAQSLFIKRVKKLTDRQNAAVILVSHPNKTVQRGEEFDYYQIAGNSDVVNACDNVIVLWREFDRMKDADGYMAVKKCREGGKLERCALRYIEQTQSLAQIVNDKVMIQKIDIYKKGEQLWEKTVDSPF